MLPLWGDAATKTSRKGNINVTSIGTNLRADSRLEKTWFAIVFPSPSFLYRRVAPAGRHALPFQWIGPGLGCECARYAFARQRTLKSIA
jgi:hypothetical protein